MPKKNGKTKNTQAMSGQINEQEIAHLQNQVNKNSKIIDELVNKLVAEYCNPLDDYMDFIRKILSDEENPPTDKELDDFTLNLPVLLYFTGEAQESLGVKEDIAKAIRMELYNDVFEKSSGTIADKTAQAELISQNEYINLVIYQRAYKKVKLRMEAGYETLQSVKKVITRRGQEYELSKVDRGRIGG